ncbi:MAG: 2-isopropylmalate synthase [Planctomycetes bacterium ADurb.Bin126]|nr:MAG: 2-isopropylmalate synthase [Planctomycetes bacterium ADurb.Bin126]HOD84643.1 2-isopropylmalate synthase [Phycisphaerae bacterium]HQL76392.1 2-isopropylmalate synthase [Phycisphaerae bacterium]
MTPNPTYKLQNIDEPNLYRELFPYTRLPRVEFDGRPVPMAPAADMWITDTTFRDGQQSRPPYSVQQIVDLFTLEHRLDGGSGLLRQSEFFLYSPKDRQAVEACVDLGFDYPQVTGWIRAVKSDFKLVKEMGLKETGILTSCSDYHVFLKLKKTRKQAMEQYLDIVRSALEEGIRPRCHFEDVTRADFYGFVVPFSIELMRLRQESGIDVKIRLCDTMGFAVPWAEATLPRSVPRLVHGMIHDAGVPGELLEWHGHDDFHKVLVNPATAWLYGCCACNSSLLGIGERTGNTPLEAMVIEAAQLKGMSDKVNYAVITEIAEYYAREIGYEVPTNFPLVGRDFNVTKAGIHADGLLKSEEIYNCFDTQAILGRNPSVAITDKSGAAGIKHWLEANYGVDVPKDDARLLAIRDRVDREYEAGRTTTISDDEMHAWYAEEFGD